MRIVMDILIVSMLVAILAGVVWHYRGQEQEYGEHAAVHEALDRLYTQMLLHATSTKDGKTQGFPPIIDQTWFEEKEQAVPVNSMAPSANPWLDIAPPGDMNDHPPDPMILTETQAGFWYNPNRGIVRARVAPQFSESETLKLYNQLNNVGIDSVKYIDDDARKPIPLEQAAEIAAATLAPGERRTLGKRGPKEQPTNESKSEPKEDTSNKRTKRTLSDRLK